MARFPPPEFRHEALDKSTPGSGKLVDFDGSGHVAGTVEVGCYRHARAFAEIMAVRESAGIKRDFVATVVPGIDQNQDIGVQVKEHDISTEYKADPGVARIAICLAVPSPLLPDSNLTEIRAPAIRSDKPIVREETAACPDRTTGVPWGTRSLIGSLDRPASWTGQFTVAGVKLST